MSDHEPEGSSEPTIREVMVELKCMKKILTNHLKHHEKYEFALITGILMLVAKQLFFG